MLEDYPLLTDPRTEQDNLGTMCCFHRHYSLGDAKHGLTMEDCRKIESSGKFHGKPCFVLPIYLYDHSGLAMNTTGFSCPWDSGKVGIIFATFETLRKALGVRRLSAKHRTIAYGLLRSEVSEYAQYIS